MIIDGNNFISHKLKTGELFAAGKIGVTELKFLYQYLLCQLPSDDLYKEGIINSGIYPANDDTFMYFCQEFLNSLGCLDLAPKDWCGILKEFHRKLYTDANLQCYDTYLQHLEPYYFDKPWTASLQNKKVLVISPFAGSIEHQHSKLDNIWGGKITSNFSLETIKFPFSPGLMDNNKYISYKECLEDTKKQILQKSFDFCIIGAGAYSIPLCAFVKKMNRSCLHLGGATQILFGIRGNRWNTIDGISKYFNSHWITPNGDEVPKKFKLMEEGCYW